VRATVLLLLLGVLYEAVLVAGRTLRHPRRIGQLGADRARLRSSSSPEDSTTAAPAPQMCPFVHAPQATLPDW
jgi:hypothetical protein